ncbi:MAG: apolipoprotein acyltransferase, partial [Methylocystis sp.]
SSSAPAPKPAAPAPKPAKLAPTTPPANDDRRSIGELRAALNFRPSGTITVMTALSIIAWTGLWTLYVYFHRESILAADGNFLAPTPILTLLALFGPIVFLFVTGIMARRVHEMRLVAKAMTEAAIRLIEPETVATEQVVSLSQAIRREAASMGDGIERALARAGELEVIVRTEVTNLERSYSENERRIRLLIDELAHEREAIILNADNARTSLYGARDSLASEVASASAHLAEQVSAAGNRVTVALGAKGEEVRLALESAGDGLDRTFAGHGDRLVATLARSGDDAAQKIGAATDNVAQRFSMGVGEIETKLAVVGDTLSRGFDEHSAGVVERIEALGLRLSQTIGGENDRLATRLADVSGRLEQTLSAQGGALDATLADSAERLAARVREHVEGARTVFEDAESQLNALLSAAHQVARDDFAARGQALHENLTRDLSQTALQLGEHANAVQERFAAVAVDAVSAIGVQGDRVTETLAERLRAFEQIVLTQGAEIAERVTGRGAHVQSALSEQIAAFENLVTERADDAANRVGEHGDRVAGALAEQLAAFEQSVATSASETANRVAQTANRVARRATARPGL